MKRLNHPLGLPDRVLFTFHRLLNPRVGVSVQSLLEVLQGKSVRLEIWETDIRIKGKCRCARNPLEGLCFIDANLDTRTLPTLHPFDQTSSFWCHVENGIPIRR